MSGNDERGREKYKINISPELRRFSDLPQVCPFCGHFGYVIDVEILDLNRFLVTCTFCGSSSEIRKVRDTR